MDGPRSLYGGGGRAGRAAATEVVHVVVVVGADHHLDGTGVVGEVEEGVEEMWGLGVAGAVVSQGEGEGEGVSEGGGDVDGVVPLRGYVFEGFLLGGHGYSAERAGEFVGEEGMWWWLW